MNRETVGARLRAARERLGLTLEQVATRLGFNNYQTLSEIEKGRRELRASELSQFSDLYCKDYAYFLSSLSREPSPPRFAWRCISFDVNSARVEAKLQQLLDYYGLFEKLIGEVSASDLGMWFLKSSDINNKAANQKGEEIATSLNLGYRPAVNLDRAIEDDLGIKLLYADLEGVASAAATKGDFGYAIVVNREDAPWRRNFNIAHELFHILCSETHPIEAQCEQETSMNRFEKAADAFAAGLLMPADSIREAVRPYVEKGQMSNTEFIALAQEFGVSSQALIWRLVNLRFIPKESAEELIHSPIFEMENKVQRSGLNCPAVKFSTRFVRLAFQAFQEGRISKGKFCQVFGITRADFASFISMYGFHEDSDDGQRIAISYS